MWNIVVMRYAELIDPPVGTRTQDFTMPQARSLSWTPALPASLATWVLAVPRAVAVPIAAAWLDRAAERVRAAGRHRARGVAPGPGPHRRRVRFLLLTAWGVGGAIRATFTTAAHLRRGHDVVVIGVFRATVEPGMAVPAGVRLRALFDGTKRGPSVRNLAATLLYRAPSRLRPYEDPGYRRASLWTDILLLRWLKYPGPGTVVVATRPALIVVASRFAPAGVVVIAQEHQRLDRHRNGVRNVLAGALPNVSLLVTLTESDRSAYRLLLGEAGPPVVAIPNAVPDVPLGPGDPEAHNLIAAGRLERRKDLICSWRRSPTSPRCTPTGLSTSSGGVRVAHRSSGPSLILGLTIASASTPDRSPGGTDARRLGVRAAIEISGLPGRAARGHVRGVGCGLLRLPDRTWRDRDRRDQRPSCSAAGHSGHGHDPGQGDGRRDTATTTRVGCAESRSPVLLGGGGSALG